MANKLARLVASKQGNIAAMRNAIIIMMLTRCASCAGRHSGLRASPSETTMNILGLRNAAYAAPNLAESRPFYTKVLGFGPYFEEPF